MGGTVTNWEGLLKNWRSDYQTEGILKSGRNRYEMGGATKNGTNHYEVWGAIQKWAGLLQNGRWLKMGGIIAKWEGLLKLGGTVLMFFLDDFYYHLA